MKYIHPIFKGWKDGGGEEGNYQRAWAIQQEQTWY